MTLKRAKIRLRLPQATQTNENRANQATIYPVRETGTHLLKSPYGLYMAFERVADFRENFPLAFLRPFANNKAGGTKGMTLDDFLDWIATNPKEWAEYKERYWWLF